MNFHGPYTGGTNTIDQATGVIVDEGGNYIVTGQCISCDPNKIQDEVMLVKIVPGTYTATQHYYGDGTERDQVGWDIIQAFDDTYVSCGVAHPPYNDCFDGATHDYYVFKADNTFADVWTPGCELEEGIGYGGDENDNSYGLANACGGFLVVGESRSVSDQVSCNHDSLPPPDREYDGWVLKIDDNGNYEWDESFGDLGNDAWRSIKRLKDGSFIMAGSIAVGSPDYLTQDFYVIKFQVTDCNPPDDLVANINGYCASMSWTMEPCVPSYDLIYRKVGAGSWTTVLDATSPKIIVNPSSGGGTEYEWRVRANCSPDYDEIDIGDNFFLPYCTGTRTGCTCSPRLAFEDSLATQLISIFPNPSTEAVTVLLNFTNTQQQKTLVEIVNHLGKVVYAAPYAILNGRLECEISVEDFAAGIYFLRIEFAGEILRSKFIVQ